MPSAANSPARLPAAIWLLGLVSMLMDISSEMIHSLLPLFMVTSLGTSALLVGLMLLWHDRFRAVFWVAVVPGLAAVARLAFGLREPAPPSMPAPSFA